jgi:hypothetical protein
MTTLYEKDFCQWSLDQASYLRNGEISQLDIENLIEEIEELGTSVHSKLKNHLRVLFCHLLKIKHQPENHTRSWDLSIKNSKLEIKDVLMDNPSLKHYLPKILKRAYASSILWAANETGLDEEIFPKECPWTVEEILNEGEK